MSQIQYVGGQVAGRANPSSAVQVTFALTGGLASTPAAGDLVIVTCVTGSAAGNPAMAVTTPTGYTNLGQLNQSAQTNDTSMDVSWKFMGGTPDTTVTIPGTGNNAFAEAYAIQVFRGVDPSQPFCATAVSAGGTGTGRPNPASITPTTPGSWPVICGGGAAGLGASYTAPANYATHFLTASGADTTDAMVGCGYRSDWTSGAEDPAAYTGGTTGSTDSWCAYTLALQPTVDLQPGLLSDADTFPSAAVSLVAGEKQRQIPGWQFLNETATAQRQIPGGPFVNETVTAASGAQDLTPSLYSDADSFFAPIVSSSYALTSSLYTDADSFFAPAVATSYALTASLYADSDAFPAATVARGAVDLAPSLFTDGDTFYAATVGQGGTTQELQPPLYADGDSFPSATVTPGAVNLAPSLYSDADTFFLPVVSTGAGQLFPELYQDADSFYNATVLPAAVSLAASLYSDADAFYAATVSQGGAPQGLTASLYSDPDSFYGPAVAATHALSPARFDDGDGFYAATVSAGVASLAPALFVDADIFYSPVVVPAGGVAADLFIDADIFYAASLGIATYGFGRHGLGRTAGHPSSSGIGNTSARPSSYGIGSTQGHE
jgi:hypothetical protein